MSDLDKKLLIHGNNLNFDTLQIKIDSENVTNLAKIEKDVIILDIPRNFPAGLKHIQVNRTIFLGSNPIPYDIENSNILVYDRAPEIESILPLSVNIGDDVVINCVPPIHERQKLSVLLNRNDNASYVINIPSITGGSLPASAILFNTAGIQKGSYLVRLVVDGSRSQVEIIDNMTVYESGFLLERVLEIK